MSPLGKVLGTESFPATAAGHRRLLVWARRLGTVRRAGVEGTGTFGAGLSRYLLAQHVQVYEVNRPDRTARRLLGKSDPFDAQAAALSGRARARAKTGDGPVHSARMFKLAKDSAVKARTQAINQLKAVLVIAGPALRERLSSLGNCELFRTCARLGLRDGGGDEDAVAQATHSVRRALRRMPLPLPLPRIRQLAHRSEAGGCAAGVLRALLLVGPAVAAVELNKVSAVTQKRSLPPSYPYSGVRGGCSLWGKRPAHSATGPGYCARRTGPTPAMVVA
ncbi:IS110 family transposase [Streptomyces umbrinus]|uniref:IS110 family transposase n=1 Tax=Streptomyces umbrinus TaxID=67370 RepID=UPI003C2FF7B0